MGEGSRMRDRDKYCSKEMRELLLKHFQVGVRYVDPHNPLRTARLLPNGIWYLCHADDCWYDDCKPYWLLVID